MDIPGQPTQSWPITNYQNVISKGLKSLTQNLWGKTWFKIKKFGDLRNIIQCLYCNTQNICIILVSSKCRVYQRFSKCGLISGCPLDSFRESMREKLFPLNMISISSIRYYLPFSLLFFYECTVGFSQRLCDIIIVLVANPSVVVYLMFKKLPVSISNPVYIDRYTALKQKLLGVYN